MKLKTRLKMKLNTKLKLGLVPGMRRVAPGWSADAPHAGAKRAVSAAGTR
jgi:hypothetical protein